MNKRQIAGSIETLRDQLPTDSSRDLFDSGVDIVASQGPWPEPTADLNDEVNQRIDSYVENRPAASYRLRRLPDVKSGMTAGAGELRHSHELGRLVQTNSGWEVVV